MNKTTLSFDAKATKLLDALASRKSVSKAEVMRRALMLYDFIEAKKGEGNTVELKSPDGKEVVLLVP